MASFTPPATGQPNSTEDSKIVTALTVFDNLLNSSDLVPTAGLADNAVTTEKITDGDITDAKMGLTTWQDTQSANIAATGVLTGVSITPGAGTYFASGTAALATGAANLSIRVNGVNVVSSGNANAVDADAILAVMGIITPTAGQAVELHSTFTSGVGPVASGRLVLIRIA